MSNFHFFKRTNIVTQQHSEDKHNVGKMVPLFQKKTFEWKLIKKIKIFYPNKIQTKRKKRWGRFLGENSKRKVNKKEIEMFHIEFG